MVATSAVALQERHAAEFRCPDDERMIEQTAALEVANQCSGRLIHYLRLHRVRVLDVRMRIPVGYTVAAGGIAAVKELNHAHALLDESPCKNTILCVLLAQITTAFRAVFLLDKLRFIRDLHHLRHGGLHLARQLVARNARGQVGVAGKFLQMPVIQRLEQIDRRRIVGRSKFLRTLQVVRRIDRRKICTLK